MGQLAIFRRGEKTASVSEPIGTGTLTRICYRPPRGPGKKRREARLLASLSDGMYGIQPDFCALCGIPCLTGDAARLVHAALPSLLPRRTERIALYPGRLFSIEILLSLSAHCRFLEMIGTAENEVLAETVFSETGICIPVRKHPSPDFLPVRLPGAEKGAGLDLTDPESACRFLPPPSLRSCWMDTPKSGAVLDALMTFFNLPTSSAGVFLSNYTK